MTAHLNEAPVSPIAASECWVFDGPGTDPFVTMSEFEAHRHAEELNSDRQRYAVVRFDAMSGTSRDVTHEFWMAPESEPDEYEYRPSHIAMMRKAGAF